MKRLLFFFFTLLFAHACEISQQDRKQAEVQDQKMPDQNADSVHIIHSEEGTIKVQIRAPKLVISNDRSDEYSEFPDGLAIEFYDKSGNKTADLFGDYGIDKPQKNERIVRKNVVIITEKNDTIKTDELIMLEKQDSIHNDGKYVSIKRQDGTFIQGYGLLSNNAFQNVSIANVFESTVTLDEESVSSTQGQTPPPPRGPQESRPRNRQR